MKLILLLVTFPIWIWVAPIILPFILIGAMGDVISGNDGSSSEGTKEKEIMDSILSEGKKLNKRVQNDVDRSSHI